MDTKLSVKQIEDAIVRTYCNTREHIIIPNLSWGLLPYEIDLAVIKSNGYMTEYEIKRSYSDLVADFKKAIYHNDERVKYFHYVLPIGIKDRAIALFDEHKQDESYKAVFGFRYPSCLFYDEQAQFVSMTSWDNLLCGSHRKLYLEEQLTVARLVSIRYWTMRQKIDDSRRQAEEQGYGNMTHEELLQEYQKQRKELGEYKNGAKDFKALYFTMVEGADYNSIERHVFFDVLEELGVNVEEKYKEIMAEAERRYKEKYPQRQ